MVNKFLKNRKSIYFSWILSYCLILSIPVITGGMIYFETGKVIEGEIKKSNQFLLGRVQQKMDSIQKDIEKLYFQIALNSNVSNILNSGASSVDSTAYYLAKLLGDMKVYNISSPTMDDFYIYFKSIDNVTSSRSSSDSGAFFRGNYSFDEDRYERWRQFVNAYYTGEYSGMNFDGSILYVRSVMTSRRDEITGNIVISVDKSRFVDEAESISYIDSAVTFILDEGNRVIAATREMDYFQNISYQAFGGNSGNLYQILDGEKMAVSYIKSDINDWMYITVIPYNAFVEKASYIKSLTLGSLALCVVLGLILIFYFSRKNYNPLAELIKLFSDDGLSDANEYGELHRHIIGSLNEKTKAYDMLKEQSKALRASFLERLLKGGRSFGKPVDELLNLYNINFGSDNFAVIVAFIENYGDILGAADTIHIDREYKLVGFIISNVVGEIINKNFTGYMTNVDETATGIINIGDEKAGQFYQLLFSDLKIAGDFLQDKYKIKLSFAASAVHKNIEGIGYAYTEAIETLEYKRIYGIDKNMMYAEIADMQADHYFYYPMEKEAQLAGSIKLGDAEKAIITLKGIIDKNFEGHFFNVQMARCLIFDITGTIIKVMGELNVEMSEKLKHRLVIPDEILKTSNVNDVRRNFEILIQELCAVVEDKKKKGRLRARVKEFIDANYANQDLSVTYIADKFGIHPVYLSREFKAETGGDSILDYINEIRLKYAKELLRESGMNIEELAYKVGYASQRTFIRAFSRHEGLAPGKYRELLKNGI